MCGIAGYIDLRSCEDDKTLTRHIRTMTDTMVTRGPDDSGIWSDAESGVALGHRRLSIIDLSPAGHQPMASTCGRYIIVYNGEIYNFAEIRNELYGAGKVFRGNSDTEVIIEGISHWGLQATLERLIGMFAFALWDRKERTLALARDRVGIKPLYWTYNNGLFAFGSELKAIMAHDRVRPVVDRDSLATYMRYSYVLAPHTIYQDVYQLEPGSFLTYNGRNAPVIEKFWSLSDIAKNGEAEPFQGSDTEAQDALDTLLRDAIKRRMVADVPLGAFLSGGIDSSLVVALMQDQADRPVKTFSIGFSEKGFNEAPYAKAVAEHLGTEHTELYASPQMALELIPSLSEHFDEPFADSSQIPTLMLSKLTRKSVTVSLSGDGGDELFAGYTRYFQALKASTNKGQETNARMMALRALSHLPKGLLNIVFGSFPGSLRRQNAGDHIHALARPQQLGASVGDASFLMAHSHWDQPDSVVCNGYERQDALRSPELKKMFPDLLQRMRFIDTVQYLPNDILTKVDRASMAASLEARVPILDHRVVEFAWRLPERFLVRDGQGKWLLRRVLERYVPNKLFDRPKMGFGVPIDKWLRGPLRDWAEDLLDAQRMEEQGFFNVDIVRSRWEQHINGENDWRYPLWDVLMFQSWHRQWMENSKTL